MKALKRLLTMVALGAMVSGCAPLIVQSPGGALSPVNAIADGDDKHLMLFGADVVAYFTERQHRQGDPAIKSVVAHVTFRFATTEHKALFDKNPDRYMPQYGGYCANGIVYGIPWGGNADSWRIIDGKLYTFGGKGSRDGFYLDLPRNIALADKYWKEEVRSANAFVQRVKRLLFRVPHYLTGRELAEEVKRRGAKS
ncbi:MAG: YHS domain-containing (seleno)protein [Burkholderiales bacterium]